MKQNKGQLNHLVHHLLKNFPIIKRIIEIETKKKLLSKILLIMINGGININVRPALG